MVLMSNWTYITGVITVDTMGRSQAEARCILDTVLAHLPKVPGSEDDMEVYVNQKRGHNSSSSHDEFGQRSNLWNDEYFHTFGMQSEYLITIDAHLRDTVFEETFRNFQKWLCRFAKRIWIKDIIVKVSDDCKSAIIQDAEPYDAMLEPFSWDIDNKTGEPNWVEFLRYDTTKEGFYPMLLAYKYYNDPDNDAEVERRMAHRKGRKNNERR